MKPFLIRLRPYVTPPRFVVMDRWKLKDSLKTRELAHLHAQGRNQYGIGFAPVAFWQ